MEGKAGAPRMTRQLPQPAPRTSQRLLLGFAQNDKLFHVRRPYGQGVADLSFGYV